MTTLHDIGEFGLIERIARVQPGVPNVIEGIGDDCAVLKAGERILLVSCDLSIEGIHFRRKHATAEDIGSKAATIALSDIAAMGGAPLFCLVSLACPGDCDVLYIEGLYDGLADAAAQYGVAIVGGDTACSPGGILLDVMAIGEPIGGRYLTRRGAQAGDRLAVTGRLGMSAAGLHALEHGHDAPALIHAHRYPNARMPEGQWLCARPEVHSLIDISDGLAQDAGHLARAANLGVDIGPALIPVSGELATYCKEHGLDPYDFILAGGEDYELAFALHASDSATIEEAFHREFQTELHEAGTFTDAWHGVRIAGRPIEKGGFDHFTSEIGDFASH